MANSFYCKGCTEHNHFPISLLLSSCILQIGTYDTTRFKSIAFSFTEQSLHKLVGLDKIFFLVGGGGGITSLIQILNSVKHCLC